MNLGIITKFSVSFDESAVNEFYEGSPKTIQLGLVPERYSQFSNRWDEFCDLMSSGKSTVLLLHNPNSRAIPIWRDQVGHFDVIKKRDPSTIRGQLAIDNYNNLVHGSDSRDSVARELVLLSELLTRTI